MRRYVPRAFGLSMLTALCMLMLGAVGAQAAEFTVEEEPIGEAEEVPILGTVGLGILLTAGTGRELHCESGNITGDILSGGKASAEILYNGCSVVDTPFCEVYENLEQAEELKEPGHINAMGNGQVIKHEDGNYYLLVAGSLPELIFTDFVLHGDFCALPAHREISGRTVFALPDAAELRVLHEIETLNPVILGELFPEDQLFTGNELNHLAGGTTASVHIEGKPSWKVVG